MRAATATATAAAAAALTVNVGAVLAVDVGAAVRPIRTEHRQHAHDVHSERLSRYDRTGFFSPIKPEHAHDALCPCDGGERLQDCDLIRELP